MVKPRPTRTPFYEQLIAALKPSLTSATLIAPAFGWPLQYRGGPRRAKRPNTPLPGCAISINPKIAATHSVAPDSLAAPGAVAAQVQRARKLDGEHRAGASARLHMNSASVSDGDLPRDEQP